MTIERYRRDKVERRVFTGLWLALLMGVAGLWAAVEQAERELLVRDSYLVCASRHETPKAIEGCVDWLVED